MGRIDEQRALKLLAACRRGGIPLCFVVTATIAATLATTSALADQAIPIPVSPEFDYSQICVAPAVPAPPRNWSGWDGKSAPKVSPDAMLKDAQALYNPYSRYPRSPATAERIVHYLGQQSFPGAGRALYLYGRILADSDVAAGHAEEIVKAEKTAYERGVIEAGTFLGKIYRRGDLVSPDLSLAKTYLRNAADAGDTGAAIELVRLYATSPDLAETPDAGRMLLQRIIGKLSENLGKGDCSALTSFAEILADPDIGERDVKASVQWLAAAAKLGDIRAISLLAKRLRDGGDGIDVDRQSAEELLRTASRLGHAASSLALADMLLATTANAQAREEGLALVGQEVARGNVAAFAMRAAYYRGSYGGDPDPALERQALEKAALLPDVSAEVLERLGVVYARGLGGPPDSARAVKVQMRAFEMGSAQAAFDLYKLGSGPDAVQLDRGPLDYLKQSSDAGFAGAMRELSALYACGQGVEKDRAKANEWLEKAAAAGDSESLLELADRAFASASSDSNADGVAYLQKAAEQGDVEAMMRLSLAYASGTGTPHDETASQSWRGKAVAADAILAKLVEAKALLVPTGSMERDAPAARALLEASLSTENADVLYELGRLYVDNDPALDPDPIRAKSLFVRAAQKGNVSAMLRLVDLKVSAAEGGGSDWQQWLDSAARSGDLRVVLKQAQVEPESSRKATMLSGLLDRPLCLDKDKVQLALALQDVPQFRDKYLAMFDGLIAEKADDPAIEYQIAAFLRDERPSEQTAAVEYMKRAAEGGKREAMRELGRLYMAGRDVGLSKEEAYGWLFKAARLGDGGALESLVKMILAQQTTLDHPTLGDQEIEGVLNKLTAENSPQVAMLLARLYLRLSDSSPAFKELGKTWILKAATLGNGQAMLLASDFYATGTHGFEQSSEKSTEWIAKAADAGFRKAFEKYAIALQIGFGTPPDEARAQEWLEKSAKLSN